VSLRRYHYRALDAHALPRHGWLEATSPDDLRRLLAEASLTLLFAWRLPGPGRRLPPAELTRLCFELGQLLDAGLPLLTALTLCQREAEDPTLAACLQRLGYDLRQGQTLSQAMSQQPRHFDGDLIATIRASEQSGDLAQAFLTLHQHRAWLAAFRQELWQALLPPLLGPSPRWRPVSSCGCIPRRHWHSSPPRKACACRTPPNGCSPGCPGSIHG